MLSVLSWIGSWLVCGLVSARPWWCAVSRVWVRRRCWMTWPGGRRGAGWCGWLACSRRWSWRTRGCISCAGRCWIWPGVCRIPQQQALRAVLGISAGPAPDRFLVALAVLGLLSEVAGEQPLICVVDDEQWLDRRVGAGAGVRGAAAGCDPVGLLFVAREPGAELAGLPELAVGGLAENYARALLDSALAGPMDARVRDQVVAEAGGNPLALLELPRGMTPGELAGGFGLPGPGVVDGPAGGQFPAAD